jgi:DNA repair photolyase
MKELIRKSLLYKSEVEYADFCINHVEGCSHGCKYPCYAYMMKKRCGIIRTYKEWCSPKIVANALELLEMEIPKYRDVIKYVHLCFSTDPFMYNQPQINELSVKIIRRLNCDKIKCTTLTKGIYPSSIVDDANIKNEYGITLVSLDEKFRNEYEPNTANFKDRIAALKNLHDAGAKTWVSMEPYPTPNIVPQNIDEILNEIKFVDKIIFGKLNYNIKSSQWLNHREYYNECSEKVINFCKKKDISYHIKNGTST